MKEEEPTTVDMVFNIVAIGGIVCAILILLNELRKFLEMRKEMQQHAQLEAIV